jgi:dethiobiotin synthetase
MDYFITGTDTDVGKTYVTGLMLKSLQSKQCRVAGYKPFAAGDRSDGFHLIANSNIELTYDEVNPQYYKSSAAPYAASLIEGGEVDFVKAIQGYQHLKTKADRVLVEGAGGWEVPLTATQTMADFALCLQLPVIVVVNNKLGAINHTLLTVKAIQARGLTCAGLILNYVQDSRDLASISNRQLITQFTDVPILAEVMHGAEDMIWEE